MSVNNHKKEEKEKQVSHEVKPAHHAQEGITLKEEEYKKLQDEAAKTKELEDRVLRLQADFDNARKRMEKQCQDFTKYANEGIILELLNILDDLENATQTAENKNTNLETFLKGIEMILTHLYEMLKAHGVRPIEAVGKPFDTHTSEALLQVASDLPEHAVVEELQKGYTLNDRVIRTVKVKVSTGKAALHKPEEVVENKDVKPA